MSKLIPLTKGLFALVDDEDFEALNAYRWHASKKAGGGGTHYAVRVVVQDGKRTVLRMHSVLMNPPTGMFVDHIDGNGLNNTRSNLRVCTRAQNAQNSGKQVRRRRGTPWSQYKGVSYDYIKKYWRPQITVCGKRISLGTYQDEAEAARAYDAAARKHHGEFARLNFPEKN